jgi:hypothetical protein
MSFHFILYHFEMLTASLNQSVIVLWLNMGNSIYHKSSADVSNQLPYNFLQVTLNIIIGIKYNLST